MNKKKYFALNAFIKMPDSLIVVRWSVSGCSTAIQLTCVYDGVPSMTV